MTDFKTATVEGLQTIIKLHEDKIKTLKAEDTSDSNKAQAIYQAVDFHENRIKKLNEILEEKKEQEYKDFKRCAD